MGANVDGTSVGGASNDVTAGQCTANEEAAEDETVTVDATGSQPEVSLDVVFEVLRNRRRRRVLQYLREHRSDTVSLSDVAEYVASLENDKPVSALSSQERKRVYVGLYQCHLPKMSDMGIVTYDQSRGSIEETDKTAQIDPYLDLRDESDSMDSLSIACVAISAVGLLSALGVAAGLAPTWFSPTVGLGALSLALLGCVAYHRR